MAAEVGLALLTASLDVLFDRLASPELLNFIKGKKLDQKLLQRFQTTLYAVGALLNDAEQKQIRDPFVKKWLDALKDAVYEADDLLDELSTRAATQKEVPNFFNLNFKDKEMGNKIEGIIQKLEEFEKRKDVLGLKNIAGKKLTEIPKSTSPLVESDVCGRKKDKEAIIDFLLSDDTSDGNKIGVIPIVGLGGIGKTTLAQLVYNDDCVKQKFDLRAWVCVSDDFDVSRIMRSIMAHISGGTCNIEDPNLLHIELQAKLKEKFFLIVLDDIWTRRYTDWDPLRTLFHHGLQGSKIIVTTRDKQAASMVKTTDIHCLDHLSDEDCWSIFVRHACPSVSISNSLLEVRDDITRKCKGLPLAAKILGGLLRSKSDIENWKIVLKSDIWDSDESGDKGISALKVSYYYLPSHLKRCFIHCSLFPKDFDFRKKELILLWMAEGLLQPIDRNMTLEEVGCAYFEELASRFFFQQSNNSQELFVMHDLIHDLAESFAGEFYHRVEIGGGKNILNQTRHLSYDNDQCGLEVQMLEATNISKTLRTFLSISRKSYPWMRFDWPKDLSRVLSSNCKCLRVLSFCHSKSCRILPNSIGELIHLRYLDLSCTDIESLPDSICKLHNLQTLKLRWCFQLFKLPDDIQDLVNLRYLDIWNAGIKEMPIGMGKLKNLQYLSDFVVGKDKGSKIGELGGLSDLANKLSLRNLQNVRKKGEVSQAQIMDKKYIEKLELFWEIHDVDDSQTEKDVLEKLKPHTNLKGLRISGYMGTKFSYWLGHHSYSNMTAIALEDCRNCCSLPPLGQLPYLKELTVSRFFVLETVDDGFYKSSDSSLSIAFPSLEYLHFGRMAAWKEWCLFEKDAFPLLKGLELVECPKIVGDLPKHLPALEYVRIIACPQLTSLIPRAPLIRNLEIQGCTKLEFPKQICCESLVSLRITASCCSSTSLWFDNFPNLQKLSIRRWENLKSISVSSASLQKLRDVEITDCPNLEFPKQICRESLVSLRINASCCSSTSLWFDNFPNLQELFISEWENLKSLSVSSASLRKLQDVVIADCPNLEFPKQICCESLVSLRITASCCCSTSLWFDKFPNLQELSIIRWENLKSISVSSASLQKLRDVVIADCPNLEFPKQICRESLVSLRITASCCCSTSLWFDNFPNLQKLSISRWENLKSISVSSASLQKLRDVEITDCPNLEFPRQICRESLVSLRITASCCSSTSLWFDNFPNLQKLSIIRWENLKSLSVSSASLQKLGDVEITDCPNLEFPRQICRESLVSLRITASCCSSTSLWFENFPNLQKLSISRWENLKSISVSSASLQKLRDVGITNCPNLEFPKQICPESLVSLRITASCCSSTSLWFDNFPNLQELSISRWENLKSISVSSASLQKLRDVEITDCPNLEFPRQICRESLVSLRITASCCCSTSLWFDKFPNLQELSIIRWENLKSLSVSSASLQKLRDVEITDCPNLEFPTQICRESLVSLRITASCCSSTSLWFENFPNLQKLSISRWENLKSISVSSASLQKLRDIVIADCPNLEFPKQICPESLVSLRITASCCSSTSLWFDNFPNLQELFISEWENLKSLSVSSASLQKLRDVEITDCPNLEFPRQICRESLVSLRITASCCSATSLWFDNFPNLQKLSISRWENLKSISVSSASLQKLRDVVIADCPNLEFPKQICREALVSLRITASCCSSTSLWFDNFPNLQKLSISRWENLKSILVSSASLQKLRDVVIADCPNLEFPKQICRESLVSLRITASCCCSTSLWFDNFPNLQELFISEWENLKSLSVSSASLQKLRDVEITDCPNLEFPRQICRESLVSLRITASCCSSTSLWFDNFPNLQKLSISRWENLKSISVSSASLQKLRDVEITDCPNLEFPRQICRESLVSLRITASCCSSTSLWFDNFPNLQKLSISRWENLKSISVSSASLQKLRDVEITDCPNLEFPRQICRESLVSLRITASCCSSTSLWFDNFPNLQKLSISRWENLKSISVSSASLQKLRDVGITNCPNLEEIQIKGNPPSNIIPWDVYDCPKLKSSPICKIHR